MQPGQAFPALAFRDVDGVVLDQMANVSASALVGKRNNARADGSSAVCSQASSNSSSIGYVSALRRSGRSSRI